MTRAFLVAPLVLVGVLAAAPASAQVRIAGASVDVCGTTPVTQPPIVVSSLAPFRGVFEFCSQESSAVTARLLMGGTTYTAQTACVGMVCTATPPLEFYTKVNSEIGPHLVTVRLENVDAVGSESAPAIQITTVSGCPDYKDRAGVSRPMKVGEWVIGSLALNPLSITDLTSVDDRSAQLKSWGLRVWFFPNLQRAGEYVMAGRCIGAGTQ